jgi:hypothetical protein
VSVKAFRLLATVIYVSYLVQVGLLMIWLPWSRLWGMLVTQMPFTVAPILDAPAIRGGITAFGVLHLVMVGVELVRAGSEPEAARSAQLR